MELRQLAAFVSTAEHGSFSRAARELGVVQPAVSQAVRRLETDLGLELLTRTTRQVTLTPAGEALLEPARSLLRAERALRERADEILAGDAGVLRLATTSGTATLVRDLIAALTHRRPGAQVRLHRARSASKLTALRTGELDAALVREQLDEPGLAAVEVARAAWLAVLAPNHPLATSNPVALHALAPHPFVALARPHGDGRQTRGPGELERAATQLGLDLHFGPVVSSVDELLATVAAPPAWTLLTDALRHQLDDVGLAALALDAPLAPPRIWLIHRDRPQPVVAELAAAARTLHEAVKP